MAKIQVGVDAGSYTYNAASRTITFSGLTGLDLSMILAVYHAPSGTALYQLNTPSLVATFAANVLTLNASVSTSYTNADPLSIFVDVTPAQVNPTAVALRDAAGNSLTSTLISGKQRLDVALGAGVQPGTAVPNWTDIVGGVDGGGIARQILVDTSGRVQVTNASVATTGTTAPTQAQLMGGSDGSLLQALPIKTVLPVDGDLCVPVRYAPEKKFRTTFAAAVANGVDTTFWTLLATGSGQTVNQTGGNLVITAGTTTNSETIIRSIQSFTDSYVLQYTATLSQRNANNNFFVEMVDVLGDGLPVTAGTNTATVTLAGLTTANVGQSVFIGNLGGLTGSIPGRFVIASVTGSTVVLTATGWTGTASGTCSLFGMNFHQVLYTGATATNVSYDAARAGYSSGYTTATINTTASPGHVGLLSCADGRLTYADQLRASNTGLQSTIRASRVENVPTHTVPLYVQIRSVNGTSAPTATTFTMGSLSVEDFNLVPVAISDVKPLSADAGVPVSIMGATGPVASKASIALTTDIAMIVRPLTMTDGTNTMPTMDAVARRGFQQLTDGTNGVGVIGGTAALKTDMSSIAGTATVSAGVAGTMAVGGNIAVGSARTLNPLTVGGVDSNNFVRAGLATTLGALVGVGPGESVTPFSFASFTGAAAVTDGTNGKTFFIQPRDGDLYLEFANMTGTSPTVEVELSYDNQTFFIAPMARVDNTASGTQFPTASAAFTPVIGATYRTKTYGAPIVRIHGVAGTTVVLNGTIRFVPNAETPGATTTYVGLTAANTTESVGVANGQFLTGGVKTLPITCKGAAKAVFNMDGMQWTGTMSVGIQVVMEAHADPLATSAAAGWQTLTMYPVAGGTPITTYTGPATAYALPITGVWEADCSGFAQVRVRMANAGTGGTVPLVWGGLKVVSQGFAQGLRSGFGFTLTGVAPTTATWNALTIEQPASPTKFILVKRVIVHSWGSFTAAQLTKLSVIRTTAASSVGDGAVTWYKRDPNDTATAVGRYGAAAAITITGSTVDNMVMGYSGTAIAAASQNQVFDFTNGGTLKGMLIPKTANAGVAFQIAGAAGGANFAFQVDFEEQA